MLVFLAVLIPYTCIFGMEGTGEMLQLVKPMSMLPCSIGHMLAVFFGIYMLAAVLYGAVIMLLYVVIVILALLTGRWRYRKLQVGKTCLSP